MINNLLTKYSVKKLANERKLNCNKPSDNLHFVAVTRTGRQLEQATTTITTTTITTHTNTHGLNVHGPNASGRPVRSFIDRIEFLIFFRKELQVPLQVYVFEMVLLHIINVNNNLMHTDI